MDDYFPSSRDGSRLTRITITLPSKIVKEVDRVVGRRGRSRFMAEAVAHRLVRVRQQQALKSFDSVLADSDDRLDPISLADWLEAIRRPTG